MNNEELFDELEDVLRECSEYFPKCDTEIYNVDSAFNKLKKRYAKYKRAFEILKDKLQLGVVDETKNGSPALFLLSSIGYDQLLDVDEYELLEELLNG